MCKIMRVDSREKRCDVENGVGGRVEPVREEGDWMGVQ